jgi:uridylate kinase
LSLPYNTTDATAVQRALELGCNTVIKATKVDGVYDKDPNKYPDAKKYETLSYEQALQEQLTIMDQHAFALARSEQLPLYVCHMNDLAMRGTSDMNGTAVGV